MFIVHLLWSMPPTVRRRRARRGRADRKGSAAKRKDSAKSRCAPPRLRQDARHARAGRRGRGRDRRAARRRAAARGLRRRRAPRPAPRRSPRAEPDVVLLDLRLPDIDGLDVCRRLRERSDVPIIVVTARGEEVDRVVGLELGADDYVVKPFGLRELIARIRAVTRRSDAARHAVRRPLRVGALEVDARARRAFARRARARADAEGVRPARRARRAIRAPPSAAGGCSRRSGRRAGTARRRRSTCTSPRSAASSATRAGSRPCAASASASRA